jgi:hypothetical protein
MENILMRVQSNVAKEFEVEKDVVCRLRFNRPSRKTRPCGRWDASQFPGADLFTCKAAQVMNEALAENVFVGLLCIMNRIPLFIVGKPGHRNKRAGISVGRGAFLLFLGVWGGGRGG